MAAYAKYLLMAQIFAYQTKSPFGRVGFRLSLKRQDFDMKLPFPFNLERLFGFMVRFQQGDFMTSQSSAGLWNECCGLLVSGQKLMTDIEVSLYALTFLRKDALEEAVLNKNSSREFEAVTKQWMQDLKILGVLNKGSDIISGSTKIASQQLLLQHNWQLDTEMNSFFEFVSTRLKH